MNDQPNQHLTVFLPQGGTCDNGAPHHQLHNIDSNDLTHFTLAIPNGTPVATCRHGHWVIAEDTDNHTDASDA